MKKSIAILLIALTMVGLASCLQQDPYHVGDRIFEGPAPVVHRV